MRRKLTNKLLFLDPLDIVGTLALANFMLSRRPYDVVEMFTYLVCSSNLFSFYFQPSDVVGAEHCFGIL
jgi:hypothetical protein